MAEVFVIRNCRSVFTGLDYRGGLFDGSGAMNTIDTICAPSTAVGGAIAVIRMAGPEALAVGRRIWRGREALGAEHARRMLLGKVGGDPVLAVYMPAPRSYTGDDVVELHSHGGALAANAVMTAALAAGCRAAEPGEFTFRAFINGKLDLVQAEAVGDLICAGSDMALKLAERQLSGVLSSEFVQLRAELSRILAECESHLDFPDEELDWDETLPAQLAVPAARLAGLAGSAEAGKLLREGVSVVIAGRPNAGKSSLLNALLGYDRAIVTDIAGTTRDTLEERAVLAGIPVRLTDTAGLREGGEVIERIGIDRSRESIRLAEVVFWVLDRTAPELDGEVRELVAAAPPKAVAVWNKSDLAGGRPVPALPYPAVAVAAVTGENLAALSEAFAAVVHGSGAWREPEFAVNRRHAAELQAAAAALPEAARLIEGGEWELAAIPLRAAIAALGRITGETVEPDVLEHIFSNFCIGK